MSLFEPARIKKLTLANRAVRSATYEGMADKEGRVTPELVSMLKTLADGEVGLIITGHAAVSPEGRAREGQLMIDSDACIDGLRSLTSTVHSAGGKIALQIAHAGIFAKPADPENIPVGASVPRFEGAPRCRALLEDKDLNELDLIVEKFAAAALRGVKAGFDAIQIHAAHTYLLSQFLSPFFNMRNGNYSGSLENRSRLLLRVISAVRVAVGTVYPLLVKINSEDFLDGGFSRRDCVTLAQLLEKAGIDAIEISGGSFLPFASWSPSRKGLIRNMEDEFYYLDAAQEIKAKLGIPVILVGGAHSLQGCNAILNKRAADFIAFCRPLISEPDLIKKWRLGKSDKSRCLSDNLCFRPISEGRPLCCVSYAKKDGRKCE